MSADWCFHSFRVFARVSNPNPSLASFIDDDGDITGMSLHAQQRYARAMDNGGNTDEALMLRYATGDATAFEMLYERHKGGLYRFFTRQCASGIAEELFQDVWMRVVAASHTYRPDARFATYLYRIAHNRLIDHYRASGRRPEITVGDDEGGVLEQPDEAAAGPQSRASRHELAEQLARCLDELPDDQREAFLLREETGLGVEEIAVATDVGRETAKSRLRYAVSRLKRCMGSVR
jgi:RNA polymerase sigma-70 factor (ECF subfamily)